MVQHMWCHIMDGKIPAEQRRYLEQYMKYLVYNMVQLVVESRLGKRIKNESKPKSDGEEWKHFHLAIPNDPEITHMTRTALKGRIPFFGTEEVYVEVSVTTSEGDNMVLEYWYLQIIGEVAEMSIIEVLNQMITMLKSLICILRLTPAHRLSKQQSADTFVMMYQVKTGEPAVGRLGGSFRRIEVGRTVTSVGTLKLSATYRTELALPPKKMCIPGVIKSDHFQSEPRPKRKSVERSILNDIQQKRVIDACADCNEDPDDRSNVTSRLLNEIGSLKLENDRLIAEKQAYLEQEAELYNIRDHLAAVMKKTGKHLLNVIEATVVDETLLSELDEDTVPIETTLCDVPKLTKEITSIEHSEVDRYEQTRLDEDTVPMETTLCDVPKLTKDIPSLENSKVDKYEQTRSVANRKNEEFWAKLTKLDSVLVNDIAGSKTACCDDITLLPMITPFGTNNVRFEYDDDLTDCFKEAAAVLEPSSSTTIVRDPIARTWKTVEVLN